MIREAQNPGGGLPEAGNRLAKERSEKFRTFAHSGVYAYNEPEPVDVVRHGLVRARVARDIVKIKNPHGWPSPRRRRCSRAAPERSLLSGAARRACSRARARRGLSPGTRSFRPLEGPR